MRQFGKYSFAVIAALYLISARPAEAACMNKFMTRLAPPRQDVTLLTGTLTFQEAQALAEAIESKKLPPIAWLDGKKTVAVQFGKLNVMRPMPVGCSGKPSGVVMTVSFITSIAPPKKMTVRLTPELTVEFEQQ
jgi:hypothetical protein